MLGAAAILSLAGGEKREDAGTVAPVGFSSGAVAELERLAQLVGSAN